VALLLARAAALDLAECTHISTGNAAENGPAYQSPGAKPSHPGRESGFAARGNRKLSTFATGRLLKFAANS